MPKLLWVIPCQRAIVSAQNTVTLIDVLEEVQIPPPPDNLVVDPSQPPLIPIRFATVSLWERASETDAGRTDARLRLLSPSRKQIGGLEFTIELAVTPRFRAIAEAAGVPYSGPGYYTVHIEIKHGERWRRAGSTGFTLRHVQPVGSAVN